MAAGLSDTLIDAPPPRLAVLLCTHDGEAFLAGQLHSLLAQNRLPQWVLVHDWGSRDGTRALVEACRQRSPAAVQWSLHWHAQAPGATRSFLDAIEHSLNTQPDFDYLLLCDQDDVWEADKLEVFARTIQAQPGLDLLYCDVSVIDAAGRPLATSYLGAGGAFGQPMDIAHACTMFVSTASGMSMALSRRFLERHRSAWAMPDWLAHDWALTILAHLTAARVAFVPQSLVRYRQHAGNLVGGQGGTRRSGQAGGWSPLAAWARARRHVDAVQRQYEACAIRLPIDAAQRPRARVGRWAVARAVLAGRSLRGLRKCRVALGYLLLWR